MDIKPALVKELRERTGAGMMECKKALVETNGDIDLAARMAAQGRGGQGRQEGFARRRRRPRRDLERRADRPARRARGQFRDGLRREGRQLPRVRRRASPASSSRSVRPNVEALLRSSVDGRTVEELRLELVTKVGENISVRRFDVVESGGTVGAYVHGTRIGVLVELEGGDAELARDLAMQIASLAPRYVSNDDVPKDSSTRSARSSWRRRPRRRSRPRSSPRWSKAACASSSTRSR